MTAMAEVGDVILHRGKWIVVPPIHCPRGHRLEPYTVLVGHVACRGHGSGHTIWHCTTCPPVEPPTYGPPLGAHCSVLNGPAEVRISSSASVEKPLPPAPEPPF